MKIYYTFRTNKDITRIKESGKFLFVFGNLKQDLQKFFNILSESAVDSIVGLAEIKGVSRVESVAVNAFGKNKKICKSGPDSFKLDLLKDNIFKVSKSHTTSFCNWTMYKISEHIQNNKLLIKHSFIHYNKADIELVLGTPNKPTPPPQPPPLQQAHT